MAGTAYQREVVLRLPTMRNWYQGGLSKLYLRRSAILARGLLPEQGTG